jgi:hypothetical protein
MSPSPAAAFAPLRHSAFRALWIANLASNTGLWIQNTGAGWMMTSLAPSPVMVSLVQAAAMLPVFLFALPGGALADILDRRAILIAAQIWIAATGLLLAMLATLGLLGAWGLLVLTFTIGTGTAVIFPAWAAATPELVPHAVATECQSDQAIQLIQRRVPATCRSKAFLANLALRHLPSSVLIREASESRSSTTFNHDPRTGLIIWP